MRTHTVKRLLALLLATIFILCGSTGCSDAAIEIGDEEVSYDLLRYFTMNYRRDLGYTAQEYADDPALAEKLETLVHDALREVMAYRALAEKYDLELSDEEEEAIRSSLEALKAQYEDVSAFEEELSREYLTEEVYCQLQELQYLAQKVYDHLTSERHNIIQTDAATIEADVKAGNFFAAEYLYIYYAESDKAEKTAFADTLHQALLAGKTMKELDDQYATEYGLAMEYVKLDAFTYTQQTEDFEELILSLKEGEYSSPTVRGDGILIARRLPLSESYVNENFDRIIQSYKEREFAYYVRDFGKKMQIVYQDDYKDLKLYEIE